MFDRKAQAQAGLLDQLGKSYFKHVVGIVTVDLSQPAGWAAGGSSGGVGGQFDYEGNALMILPSWMRASDLMISPNSSAAARGQASGLMYVFLNSKDNPGIPMNVNATGNFDSTDGFTSICCSFNKFFIYVASNPINGAVINLAVLKGLDLSGCGSDSRASDAHLVGAYGAGADYV